MRVRFLLGAPRLLTQSLLAFSYFLVAFRFKTFKVYKEAKRYDKHCLLLSQKYIKNKNPELSSQIEKALISIILNIAEGSGGESDGEFARFISISIKSLYETVAGFDIAQDLSYITTDKQTEIENMAENILRQLCAFRNKLKNS